MRGLKVVRGGGGGAATDDAARGREIVGVEGESGASVRVERRRREGVSGGFVRESGAEGGGRGEAEEVEAWEVVGARDADSCEIDWKEALSASREVSRASARLFICYEAGESQFSSPAWAYARVAHLANRIARVNELGMVVVDQ